MIVVPDVRGDGGPIDDGALVPGKELEEGELARRQRDGMAPTHDVAGGQIDIQVRHLHALRQHRRPATGQRADAGQQLPKGKRLREIVVRPSLESAHAVVDRVPGRQHQDRSRHPPPTQRCAEVEPRPVGKQHIEDNDLVCPERSALASAGDGVGKHGLYMVLAETLCKDLGELPIILDNEEAHWGKGG